jgi:hypothetical protein
MILAPLAARAASPEESYLGDRDRYIEKFNPAGNAGEISERTRKDEERARADLEHELRSIIGPSRLQGFPGPGKGNLASLFSGDEDFGLLDGLVFASKNGIAKFGDVGHGGVTLGIRGHFISARRGRDLRA